MRIQLIICGFRLHFADFAYSYGFYYSLSLLNTYNTCLWIPQTVSVSANFVADSKKFVADYASCLILEQFRAIDCFSYLSRESKTAKKIIKISNVADSATILFFACCGIRLKFTKCTVWPRNVPMVHIDRSFY